MKRYWIAGSLVLVFFLITFLLLEKLNLSFLANSYDLLKVSGLGAALAGIGLLIADVILPIPASLVMIANGALFGVGVGMILSLVGNLGAALVGFFIGRRGEPMLARFVSYEERSQANHLLKEWGLLAIIVTRPIPLLAETTVVMAGASDMGWKPMILAALAGSFPIAVVYALTGATAANFGGGTLAFGLVLLVAGFFLVLGRRLNQTIRRPRTNEDVVC